MIEGGHALGDLRTIAACDRRRPIATTTACNFKLLELLQLSVQSDCNRDLVSRAILAIAGVRYISIETSRSCIRSGALPGYFNPSTKINPNFQSKLQIDLHGSLPNFQEKLEVWY